MLCGFVAGSRPIGLSVTDPNERKRHREGRALPKRALNFDRAAHQSRQAPADRQPETCAAEAPRRRTIDLSEAAEQAVEAVRGDAYARVSDAQLQTFAGMRCNYGYLARLGELQRVGNQVGENLADPGRVAPID